MCTKNTELTRAHFARKVGFASHKKLLVPALPSSGAATTDNGKKDEYQVGNEMKSEQWKTYRTRFLVKAKKLNSGLSFVDHLGRQHCGRKGDYLVESCDGVLSIAPKQIFEDIYVAMTGRPARSASRTQNQPEQNPSDHEKAVEALKVERINTVSFRPNQNAVLQPGSPVRRKLPQPFREIPSGIRLM